ncbi:MAG: PilZ domain-containing protein [Pseudomonadota bacterium]
MSNPNPINASGRVVHEAEAHRQHVRIRLPGRVKVKDREGRVQEFDLIDISAGGMAIETGTVTLDPRKTQRAELVLRYDTFTYTVNISFQPLAVRNGRTACVFQDVGPREADALRAIINSFLAGDVLALNEILHIVQRDNTALARKSAALELSTGVRAVAALGTIAVLLLGLFAFTYVFSQVYQLLFVTKSMAAVVTADTIMVRMPEDGIFQSLIRTSQHRLKKGQPLGTFTEILPPPPPGVSIRKPRQVTIMSPCNCDLMALPMGEAGVLQKGDALFQLRPFNSRRWIAATLLPAAAHDLAPGDEVRVSVKAMGYHRWGTVDRVEGSRLDNVSVADSVVRVMVSIPDGIPVEALGLPADVIKHPPAVGMVLQSLGM